jgi:hypothetical protein
MGKQILPYENDGKEFNLFRPGLLYDISIHYAHGSGWIQGYSALFRPCSMHFSAPVLERIDRWQVPIRWIK